MNTNPYTEPPAAVAARDQNAAAYRDWRNSFTPLGWERRQLQRRQQLIDEGATVRSDGRLEFQVRKAGR